ncbi:hypothetical protein SCFA_770023 [anaerobic digester metagenome]|uniref:Uncharacterized protein n=1 Tax=anaerobic digester metagenome TaxID=1263854 RepID=A0A485M4G7_9ZZZZ
MLAYALLYDCDYTFPDIGMRIQD